jgi:hypothetical protein
MTWGPIILVFSPFAVIAAVFAYQAWTYEFLPPFRRRRP